MNSEIISIAIIRLQIADYKARKEAFKLLILMKEVFNNGNKM